MSLQFDRKKFFDAYRREFGGLTQQRVNGLSRLLAGIENDPHIPDDDIGICYASYMLATVKRETANTFTPIHEYGSKAYFIRRYGGQGRKGKELGNDSPEEGYFYRGGGDVQTTGEANFEKAETALRREYPDLVADFERRTGRRFDLTVGDQSGDEHDPDNILDPAISYAVMSYGMRTGMFTGKRLADFITPRKVNYIGARRIVNGKDHAEEIAASAEKFEKILRASQTDSAAVPAAENHGSVTEMNLGGGQIDDAGDDPSSAAKPPIDTPASLIPLTTPVVEVETVTAAGPAGDTKPPEESTLTKIGNKANAAYTSFGGLVAGIIAWFSGAATEIIIGVVAAIISLGLAYMIINALRAGQKDKRDRADKLELARIEAEERQKREARAHEIQVMTLKSAMEPDLQTVRLIPPPPATELPNSESA